MRCNNTCFSVPLVIEFLARPLDVHASLAWVLVDYTFVDAERKHFHFVPAP